MENNSVLNLLLADDDSDDCLFFAMTLKELPFITTLKTVSDGIELLSYLSEAAVLPDALFLDLNMPLKNGVECLTEIRQDKKLDKLPVIIYSTSLHYNVADHIYQMGAHYYVRKSSLEELTRVLQLLLTLLAEKRLFRPARDKFILSPVDGS